MDEPQAMTRPEIQQFMAELARLEALTVWGDGLWAMFSDDWWEGPL